MILFHGSPRPDLKVLTPMAGHKPHFLSVRPRVWATPDLKTAIIHSTDKRDSDIGSGTVNGVHYLEERRPGGLSTLDVPGHLYGVLNPKSFRPLIKEGRPSHREYFSEEAVPVVHILEIPNVLDLLRAIRMKIVPFGVKASYLSGRWDIPGAFDPIDIHNLQRAEFAAEVAARSVGPMVKKASKQAVDLINSLPDNFQTAHAKRIRTVMDKVGWSFGFEDALGEETLVHYAIEPYKILRPLTYEELLEHRSEKRGAEWAKKYVESRRRYEAKYRGVLKKQGLPQDPKKSFLYYTLLGKHLLEWAKEDYEHRIPLVREIIRETFFDVVGLPREAGRIPPPAQLIGEKGLERALELWEKYKNKLKKTKFMQMTIDPRIEVFTQKELTPVEIWKSGKRLSRHALP